MLECVNIYSSFTKTIGAHKLKWVVLAMIIATETS